MDLHGCETIGAFEERSIAEQRVQAVFVDPKEGPGGPVAIVLGESPEAGDKANRKEQRSPEDGQGVASWENADGRTFVTLTAKRTPKADFEAIAEHISGKGEPPARYIKMTASPSEAESDATRIQGSSCVLDGQFYAVEIAEGTLAGRSLYFGATDPLKVLNEGGHEPKSATGLSIALFGPKQFPIREASEAEWAEMREAAKSYQRRQQPPSSKR